MSRKGDEVQSALEIAIEMAVKLVTVEAKL